MNASPCIDNRQTQAGTGKWLLCEPALLKHADGLSQQQVQFQLYLTNLGVMCWKLDLSTRSCKARNNYTTSDMLID